MATAYDLSTETYAGTGLLASDHVISDGVMIRSDERDTMDSARGTKLPEGMVLAPIAGDANDRYGAVRRATVPDTAAGGASGTELVVSLAHTSQAHQFTAGDTVQIWTDAGGGLATAPGATVVTMNGVTLCCQNITAAGVDYSGTIHLEVSDTGYGQTACILLEEVELHDDAQNTVVDTPAHVLRHGMVQTEGISMPNVVEGGSLDAQLKNEDMESLITFV